VKSVSTNGNSGTATIDTSAKTLQIPLAKEGGSWKVQAGGA
jgi:hypothetical protein